MKFVTCFLLCELTLKLIHYHICALFRYHVPRSWFKPTGNILVIFEEKGGDPSKIRFSTRKVSSLCAHIAEDHPSFDLEHLQIRSMEKYKKKASVSLKCPTSTKISAVKFASFGDPVGRCGTYAVGGCHDPNSVSIVQKVKPTHPVPNGSMFYIYDWMIFADLLKQGGVRIGSKPREF